MAIISHKKLALIHLIKKELRLNDGEYRRIMYDATGVTSARDLSEAQFRLLLNYFVRSPHYLANSRGMTIRQKMYIESLARDLGWDAQHLDHFIHKYYHERDLRSMNKREASHLIESLKHIHVSDSLLVSAL